MRYLLFFRFVHVVSSEYLHETFQILNCLSAICLIYIDYITKIKFLSSMMLPVMVTDS